MTEEAVVPGKSSLAGAPILKERNSLPRAMVSSFSGPGIGFGFGVGRGFGVGWGFGGMPLNAFGMGIGGGCGSGLGLGWGFGSAIGCKYRSSKVLFQGIEFSKKIESDQAANIDSIKQ